MRFGVGDTIAVVGGSIAGLTATQELRRLGFAGRIRVLDADPHAPYRRPEVSKSMLALLEVAPSSFIAWPDDLRAERSSEFRVTSVDLGARVLFGRQDGKCTSLPYDGLVIACGCQARSLLPVVSTDRVHILRSMADALRLRGPLREARTVGVVGGGFIGLEVAALAASRGKDVTVIETARLPLEPQLGTELATRLVRRHAASGVTFVLGDHVAEIDPVAAGVRLVTAGGREVVADLVVEAVGSRPATDWLDGASLDLSEGLVCDATCAVEGTQDVVAAGDVAVWTNPLYRRRMRVEHWTNAIEQAVYAAGRLLGVHDPEGYRGLPYFWSTQGPVKVQALGSTFGHDAATVLREDESSALVEYRKGEQLIAVAGIGAGRDVMRSRSALMASLG